MRPCISCDFVDFVLISFILLIFFVFVWKEKKGVILEAKKCLCVWFSGFFSFSHRAVVVIHHVLPSLIPQPLPYSNSFDSPEKLFFFLYCVLFQRFGVFVLLLKNVHLDGAPSIINGTLASLTVDFVLQLVVNSIVFARSLSRLNFPKEFRR